MAANRGDGLRSPVKRQRGPRASSQQDVVVLTGVANEIDDVADQLVVDTDGPLASSRERTDEVLLAICEKLGIDPARYEVSSP